MERLSSLIAETGYLSGETFTETDLRAAAYLSYLVPRPWCPYRMPDPVPDGVARLRAAYERSPALLWATHMYRTHRGVSMAENHEATGADVL
jgi:glutathione S-transferase